ncbi:MAG: Sec-independent protein translocase protein TatB [Casimicrobiaceae bacterium]
MFDLSFSELALIAVVALVVLGPEKLPRLARTAGHLLGRARSYANQVKSDIDREMHLDELRKLQQEAQDAARSFEASVNQFGQTVESEAAKLEQSVASGWDTASEPDDPLATSLAEQAQAANAKRKSRDDARLRLDSPLAPAWQLAPPAPSDHGPEAAIGFSARASSPLGEAWPTPPRHDRARAMHPPGSAERAGS